LKGKRLEKRREKVDARWKCRMNGGKMMEVKRSEQVEKQEDGFCGNAGREKKGKVREWEG
jgi:hypothetical protein